MSTTCKAVHESHSVRVICPSHPWEDSQRFDLWIPFVSSPNLPRLCISRVKITNQSRWMTHRQIYSDHCPFICIQGHSHSSHHRGRRSRSSPHARRRLPRCFIVIPCPFVIVPWRLIFIFVPLHFLLIPFLFSLVFHRCYRK